MKILKTIGSLIGGAARPFPLSGIVKETGTAIKEVKEQKRYDKLLRLAAYLVIGGLLYYVLAKGLMTIEEIQQLIDIVTGLPQ